MDQFAALFHTGKQEKERVGMKYGKIRAGFLALGICAVLLGGCGSDGEKGASGGQQVITVWHYYNGVQQQAFDSMVEEFNETLGREKGILVESYSQGSVEGLLQVVMDAADKKVGASQMPNICSAYSDTAYQMYQRGLTADISRYLTEKEREAYLDSYMKEGEFREGELSIFPVAKATEVLVLNRTDWEPFAEANQLDVEMLQTYEGLVRVAEMYYEWTDAQTPEPGDGKAFFGRDALANLFFAGGRQLGTEILGRTEDGGTAVDVDYGLMRRIWDTFYIPYVKGYFYKGGRFSSDDMSAGQIIAYVGSSSSASYAPSEVALNENESYPIELEVLQCPILEGGEHAAIQQGAGMAVLNTSEREVEASVTFLKWFTQNERNVRFSTSAGYLPVTCDEGTYAALDNAVQEMASPVQRQMAGVSMEMRNQWVMYTPPAVPGGEQVRSVLEDSLLELAQADRQEVIRELEAGKPADQVYQSYLEESYFDKWYQSTKEKIETAVK